MNAKILIIFIIIGTCYTIIPQELAKAKVHKIDLKY
jgi:hypothetical protein